MLPAYLVGLGHEKKIPRDVLFSGRLLGVNQPISYLLLMISLKINTVIKTPTLGNI